MPPIRIEGLTKTYKDGPRAVDHIDLEIRDGEFMVLVGPSGCGKSTLLQMLAGIVDVSEGTIHIGDQDVTRLDPRKRDIAMVFQSYALYPHLSVRGNLGFGLKLRGTDKAEIGRRVEDVARILGLDEVLDRKPGELSGGQRQRVAMGRAIVREPRAFLMDEPLSNLDAKLRVSMRAQLSRLHERLGVTTVYVTHDQIEAMTLGDRVAVLRRGVLQQCDTPQTLFARPANLFVAAFIGSPAMNLVEANVGGDAVQLLGQSIPLDRERRPTFARAGHAILGIRPEAFEDVAFAPPGRPQVEVTVSVIEELGSDAFVFFEIDEKAIVVDEATSAEEDDATLLQTDKALFAARVDPRTEARIGDRLTLAIDPSRLYFFDPETGESLLGSTAPAAATA
jgi:multiple sugar transport system ATP-binding protein